MKPLILIGASGFLGSYVNETLRPRVCPLRFEDDLMNWRKYSRDNSDAGAVILLSRACKKTVPRRNQQTMLNEVSGISKILDAFQNQHFVFASTKVVYGLTDNSVNPITRKTITENISKSLSGQFINTTVDLPESNFNQLSIDDLGIEHQIYAHTKLCGESLIKYCAKSYTIFRIWDIIH